MGFDLKMLNIKCNFLLNTDKSIFGLSVKSSFASSFTFILFLLVSGCTTRQISNNDKPELTFFDVGNGTCSLISCGKQNAILYDCGYSNSKYSKSQMLEIILEEVKDRDLFILVSHGDTDHYNLVQSIVLNNKSEIIGYGGNKADYGALQSLMPESNDLSIATKKLNSICPQIKMKLIEGPTSSKTNVTSLMLIGEYRNFKFVFSGDATGHTERNALNRSGNDLKNVNLLAASHHGADSEGSNHNGWVQYLNPQYIVFSAGNHRGYGHPRCSVRDRYEAVAIKSTPHPLSCWENKVRQKNEVYQKAIFNTYDSGKLVFDIINERVEGIDKESNDFKKDQRRNSKKIKIAKQVINTNEFECIEKTCGEISTCEEAMYLFKVCGYSRLDGNRGTKGIPCEKLCIK